MNRREDRTPIAVGGAPAASEVTCDYCGGAFSTDEVRCPYCNALNPRGAENAYMSKLEDLRDDTDRLDDDAQREFKSNVKHNAASIVRTMVIVIFVIVALFYLVRHLYL